MRRSVRRDESEKIDEMHELSWIALMTCGLGVSRCLQISCCGYPTPHHDDMPTCLVQTQAYPEPQASVPTPSLFYDWHLTICQAEAKNPYPAAQSPTGVVYISSSGAAAAAAAVVESHLKHSTASRICSGVIPRPSQCDPNTRPSVSPCTVTIPRTKKCTRRTALPSQSPSCVPYR